MTAIALWRHNQRQTSGEISKVKERLRSWLKTLASLVVVMGLTWIFGVLIVEVEELVSLAYIYTIMHGGLPRTLHLPHLCSLPQGSQGFLCQGVEEEHLDIGHLH